MDELRKKGLEKMKEVYAWDMPDMPGRFFNANSPLRQRCAFGSRETANASISRASTPAVARHE